MAAGVIQAKKKGAMDFRQSIHEDGVEQLRDHFKKVGLCEECKTRQRRAPALAVPTPHCALCERVSVQVRRPLSVSPIWPFALDIDDDTLAGCNRTFAVLPRACQLVRLVPRPQPLTRADPKRRKHAEQQQLSYQVGLAAAE